MPPLDIREAISEICVKDIVVGVLSGRGQQTQHNLYKSISIPLMLDSKAKKNVRMRIELLWRLFFETRVRR